MAFSNADKARHGQSAHDSLENILGRCKGLGYLKAVYPTFRIGKKDYKNTSQFYAPFAVEFQDGAKWVLFTTTSMRSDRIKGQQWDALNLKGIDPSIKKAYLVYPDGIPGEEKAEFVRQNKKYIDKEEYSAIDGVISQDGIYNMIEDYAIRNMTVGQIKDIQGRSFEKRVADILSNGQNIKKWKDGIPTLEGMHYDVFKKIVTCFGLDQENTKSIHATSNPEDIGRLPSRGNPKTDVLVRVVDNDGAEHIYTISCKRSSDRQVSVHHYTADAFADVLDGDNRHLRQLLHLFQEHPSLSSFGEDNCAALTRELEPHLQKLSLWVLGGYGGKGDPETQCAGFMLVYDNNDNSVEIDSIGNYCSRLMKISKGHFGTPFSWSYPSKRRGKFIQLKCRILK